MNRPREEIEQLLNFLPPRAALDRAGTIDAVATPITGADPDVSDVIVAQYEDLREHALMARCARPGSRPT